MRRRLMPGKINLSSERESGNLRPGERFRNHIRHLAADPVLSVQPSAGRNPFLTSSTPLRERIPTGLMHTHEYLRWVPATTALLQPKITNRLTRRAPPL